MRILLVGDGAREHAIAAQLARSSELYCVMSRKNPGIAKLAQGSFVAPPTAVEVIGSWAIKRGVDLAFVTSESALATGLTDALAEAGIALAAPRMDAAVVGNNTIYSFNLMDEAKIPHPGFVVCKTKGDMSLALLEFKSVVIKPSIRTELRGLRFTEKDFEKKKDILNHGSSLIERHGSVIFEKLADGEVFSVQAFTDGKKISAMPPVQIASRVAESGLGELTEGVGGYSTGKLLPFIRNQDFESARTYLQKIVDKLRTRGILYKGVLHGRFLATKRKVQMLDINSTFGSVEAINNLGILRTQLAEILNSIAQGSLKSAAFDESSTVTKFILPNIYPRKIRKKQKIGIDEKMIWENGSKFFFESVERIKGRYMISGGRALAVFAKGKDIYEAEERADAASKSISGAVKYRSDIAKEEFLQKRIDHMKRLRS
jgi:phosphoribosylamine--glycine ligase